MIKLDLQLAELGKIKIGKKGAEKVSRNGNKFRMPIKLDHFEITTMERDNNGDYVIDKELMSHYPKNPTTLNIFFLSDDIDNNFQTQFALYSGSECRCAGDGRTAKRKLKNGQIEIVECNPQTCEFYQSNKCKIGGVLCCLLSESQTVGGVWKLRTHSFHSVRNILGSLALIKEITGGILSGIKFQLTLSPKSVNVEGRSTTVQVLNIEYRGLRDNLLETVIKIKEDRIAFGANMKQLEFKAKSIEDMTAEEIKDIADEFFPENQSDNEAVESNIEGLEVENNSEKLNKSAKSQDVEPAKAEVENKETPDAEQKTEEEIEKEKEKEKEKEVINAIKESIQKLYTDNKVSSGEQRQINTDVLGTAELSRSRSLKKLQKLLNYLVETLSDDKEEL